jgi:hypothetical protein
MECESIVNTLSHKQADVSQSSLQSLATLLKHLPGKENVLLIRAPGFLAAMEALLTPAGLKKTETALSALNQVQKLIDHFSQEECRKELIDRRALLRWFALLLRRMLRYR